MTDALKTILNYPQTVEFPSCWAEAELRLAAAGVDFTPETISEMRIFSWVSPVTVRCFENLFIAFVKSAAFAKNFIPDALNWVFMPMNSDPAYTVEEIDNFEDIFMSKYCRPGTWDDVCPANDIREKRQLAVKTLVMNRSIEISPKTCLEYILSHNDSILEHEPFFCKLLAKKFEDLGKPSVAEKLLTSVQDSAKNEMFLK